MFTTVGSEEKAEAVRALGADHVINYRAAAFEKVILETTGGEGVDVILDMVGGDYVERNWKAAAVEGRICQIATLNGVAENVNFSRLMVKRLTHTGSTLRPRKRCFQDRHCGEPGITGLAVDRGRKSEAGHGFHVPARKGCRCAPADGKLWTYWQNRPDGRCVKQHGGTLKWPVTDSICVSAMFGIYSRHFP